MSTYGHPSEDAARERLKRAYSANVRSLARVRDGSQKRAGTHELRISAQGFAPPDPTVSIASGSGCSWLGRAESSYRSGSGGSDRDVRFNCSVEGAASGVVLAREYDDPITACPLGVVEGGVGALQHRLDVRRRHGGEHSGTHAHGR